MGSGERRGIALVCPSIQKPRLQNDLMMESHIGVSENRLFSQSYMAILIQNMITSMISHEFSGTHGVTWAPQFQTSGEQASAEIILSFLRLAVGGTAFGAACGVIVARV